MKRRFAALVCIAAGAWLGATADAQPQGPYASKPIRLISPFAQGRRTGSRRGGWCWGGDGARPPGWMRRLATALATATGALAFAVSSASLAQTYPTKPIRLISPFAPGGGASIMARYIGQELTEAWGQSVVVDNRGGGGGVIGTEMAARALPDGYTLVMATASTIAVNPVVSKVPFDPIKDFTPIVHTSTVPLVLVVHASLPVKSVKELIGYSRDPQAKLNYASSGEGTISHLSGELFKSMTGAVLVHVPYKGGGQAVIDLVAGHVQTGFVNILEALPHVNSGRLRGLAVSTASRSAVMPNTPTVAESGVPGFEVTQWSGVLAPAGLPAAIATQLNREIGRILAKPEMRERLLASGADPGGGPPEKFAALIRSDIAKWSKLARSLKLDARH
ncbi:MAG: tripartite tricarboxylate transporter substrate binding protein [Rhodospirillaceae bacterium]